jgi:hypothetical protein
MRLHTYLHTHAHTAHTHTRYARHMRTHAEATAHSRARRPAVAGKVQPLGLDDLVRGMCIARNTRTLCAWRTRCGDVPRDAAALACATLARGSAPPIAGDHEGWVELFRSAESGDTAGLVWDCAP